MDEHSIPNAYVYALGKKDKRVLDSSLFDEKPKYEMAKEYFESGKYLWNSGMFIFKYETIMNALMYFS